MKSCTLKSILGEYDILAERVLYRVKFAVKRSLSFCGHMPITAAINHRLHKKVALSNYSIPYPSDGCHLSIATESNA
jgi:hypothetical protein